MKSAFLSMSLVFSLHQSAVRDRCHAFSLSACLSLSFLWHAAMSVPVKNVGTGKPGGGTGENRDVL